jgi:DHA1 family bicyclomycin/chloramphenicol resistance-like MFS transporter
MKFIQEKHQGITTILAFALIPLSGFATDIYIPSLPAMSKDLHVSGAAVQLSLIFFLVSSGISQFFIGSLLDSFGRYRPGLIALAGFIISSILIAVSHQIYVIYLMRIVQGITVATIVVGKRAYFMDTYSGNKLKQYTSLFSIIWAAAPIVAPFIGGYLQEVFGWAANFYFLAILTGVIFVLELIYGGESLNSFQLFKLQPILKIYQQTLRTADFTLGLLLISLAYSIMIIYGMSSPFVIEHVFHRSAVVTGYCSLLSGTSLMTGGIISKLLIKRSIIKKLVIAIVLQVTLAITMLISGHYFSDLITFVGFTLFIHLLSGFIFNSVFAYCLERFHTNAGIVSGVTGGSLHLLTSILSYGIVNLIVIRNQELLGGAFLTFTLLAGIMVMFFYRAVKSRQPLPA